MRFITVVCPASAVEAVRADCAACGAHGDGMFTCEAAGDDGHFFISSGHAPDDIMAAIEAAALVYDLDVTSEQPMVAMDRLGLSIVE